MKTPVRCTQTDSWKRLRERFEGSGRSLDLRQLFREDGARFEHFSQEAPGVFADLSKNLIDRETEGLLLELARERGVEVQRDAMFRGEKINRTEDRAVLHTLLRSPASPVKSPPPDGPETKRAQVHEALQGMLSYAESVRADARITDIVNIGIGGSDLGPQMAVLALRGSRQASRSFHFVSNVDGHEIDSVLSQIRPESSLFLVASKTFTTAETMANARSAKAWFLAQGGKDIQRHFVALTSNVTAAEEFGIKTNFGFWDWVGGRYSLWSAIGLPIALAVGRQAFSELLIGAHEMDQHFQTARLERNLPVRLGLLDVWYRNFYGFGSRCVAPYHSDLRRLPAYLQQLEMESNGKRVDMEGVKLDLATAPVIWGEPGTNGQHAFFQMLHQGSEVIPVEIIVVKRPRHDLPGHHEMLLANALAQAQALMIGQADSGGHRDFPGNRPSSFFVLQQLDPRTLGALIALFEHRVFVSGVVWGINSFDQWGVELGKSLAKRLEPRLSTLDTSDVDPSTAGLLRRLSTSGGPE